MPQDVHLFNLIRCLLSRPKLSKESYISREMQTLHVLQKCKETQSGTVATTTSECQVRDRISYINPNDGTHSSLVKSAGAMTHGLMKTKIANLIGGLPTLIPVPARRL